MEMNPCEAILNNVVGTRILVDESVASGVEQFVLISTDKAVRPQSIMGASKRVCEMIVQARCRGGATRFSCVRFGNVVGSRGSVVPLFQEQISRGGPITVTHPDMQRFLMTIPEAVHLVIRAGTMGSLGEIFVFDMGDPVPILNLARDLVELSGLRPDRDVRIEITQLRPGEKLVEELYDASCEELAPTGFEKIRVVKARPLDVEAFAGRLAALEDSARRESPEEICRILYELNVGFNPQAGGSATQKRVLRRESVGET
jgi:FlaA1/EpsC-like NDP-sugar epimerase